MPVPACPECGFDGAGLGPRDAAVALRTFARRFTELLAPDGDDDGPPPSEEVVAARRATAAGEASAAAGEVAAAGEALRRVLIEERPLLRPDATGAATEPGAAPADGAGAEAAIAELGAVAASVAEVAASTPAEAWERTGVRSGQPVSALQLLHEAVHAGAHHLRRAGR